MRRSLGPKRRSSLYRDLGWLMDSAPFCCRVLSQIYSVLLPFWYINFYSIWFAAIAMVIGRKGVRAQLRFPSKSLFLSPSLPCILSRFFFPCRFLDLLLLSSRSAITRKGHFAAYAHPKCAIRAQSTILLKSDVMLYALRFFKFMERCFRESFLLFDIRDIEESTLESRVYLSHINYIRINFCY